MFKHFGIAAVLIFLGTLSGGLVSAHQEKEEDSSLRDKILKAAQSAFVRVQFEFQKDPQERMPKDMLIEMHLRNKTTWDTTGILLKSDGTIMMPDPMIHTKYVKKITVVDSEEKSYEAELGRFLTHHPVIFLKIKGSQKPAGGIDFAEAGDLTPKRKLATARLFKDNEQWYMSVSPAAPSASVPYGSTSKEKPWVQISPRSSSQITDLVAQTGGDSPYLDTTAVCTLLFDEKGLPIGFPADGRIEIGGDRYGWKGADLLKAASMTYADLERKCEEIKKAFSGLIVETKFTFRQQEKTKDDAGRYGRIYPGGMYGRGGVDLDIHEKKLYGLALESGKIFVPETLPKDLIHRIEKIEAAAGDKKVPATFVGAFEEFSGMLLSLQDKDALRAPASLEKSPAFELGQAFFTLRVEEKFNKRYEECHYDRFAGIMKGYKNRTQHSTSRTPESGTFCISMDGRIGAVLMKEKRDLEDRLSDRMGYLSPYMMMSEEDEDFNPYSPMASLLGARFVRPYFPAQIKTVLSNPAAHVDKKLVPLSEREMKRILWLGVEFQMVTKELAEQLECQKDTREGELGLLINHIYEDSPAAKAGLKNGDILLKIQQEEKDPIELQSQGGYDPYEQMYAYYYSRGGMGGGMDMEGFQPWRGANNYLNRILTQIGEGKKISLTTWRDKKVITHEFALEKSPYDFDSAEKFKDETTGITVRNLTYEVRHALRLAKEFQAVIIGKVEEGSAAAIGGMRAFELITKIDGQPVSSVEEFKKILGTLVQDKTREKVRFTVEIMGKSRFIDVQTKNIPREAAPKKPNEPPEED